MPRTATTKALREAARAAAKAVDDAAAAAVEAKRAEAASVASAAVAALLNHDAPTKDWAEAGPGKVKTTLAGVEVIYDGAVLWATGPGRPETPILTLADFGRLVPAGP